MTARPRSTASVVRTEGIISTRQRGIIVANAYMSDGRTVRFGVIARDPLTIRTMGSEARPGDEDAILAWLAAEGRYT